MSIMNVWRKGLTAAALPAVAALGAAGLAIAAPAQAASTAPAQAGLHVAGTVDLGRLGNSFSYVFSEDPHGNIYYARARSSTWSRATAPRSRRCGRPDRC
jgi:hypothetical protein